MILQSFEREKGLGKFFVVGSLCYCPFMQILNSIFFFNELFHFCCSILGLWIDFKYLLL